MSDKEQIEALKAQVNCLRKALLIALENSLIPCECEAALQATPEQCLAEVKAKAIRVMQCELEAFGAIIKRSDVDKYVDKLREQAK